MRKKSLLRKFVLVFASYAITLSLPTSVCAQSAGEEKITFDLKNAPLTEIFRQIETQTDKRIAYDDSILSGVRIDLAVRNESAEGVLDKALRNTGLTYQVKGNYVVIARKADPRSAAVTVSGRVADSAGPLVGATVIVKGSGTGTVTNEKGEYRLGGLRQDAVLVFSFVGMQTQEVPVGNRTRINVTMQADSNEIEEVVVSYSSQKKTSLTASVGMIKNDKIFSKPVADVSSALVGQMSGLITAQSSGEVGVDKTEIYIRGISTFGNSSPLIIVDGVQRGDLSMLDANVIESVSVLKDAAAVAPYGMAGANGVILITTKSGSKSRPTLTYNGYSGFQNPTVTPKLLNSYDYARMMNEAVRNADPKATLPYANPEGYLKTIRRTPDADYDRYPNSNAWDEIYNENAVITSHNVGLSGGTDAVKYYMGLGYLYQQGMWPTSHMNKYNMLLNLEARATRTTTIKLSFNGNLRRLKAPEASESHIMSYVLQYKPVDAFRFTNGLLGASNGKNPYGMTRTGERLYEDTNIFTQLSVEQELPFVPGLKIKGVFSFDPTSVFQKTWHEPEMTYHVINTNVLPYEYAPVVSSEKPSLAQSESNSKAYTFQGMLTYANTFGKHSVSALAVVEARQVDYRNMSASRTNFDLNIPELSMGNSNTSNWSNGGGSSKATQVGYVYRVSYEYDHKYLLETAGRYDGNYYFAKGKKFGFFPSVSAGWRVSEEPFIRNNLPWLNNLKIRASWGESGNLAGAPFQYSSAMNVYGGAYVFDGYLYQGVSESLEPNLNITWEKARKTNVGVDIGLWDNRLTLEVDYFYERRNNMLVSPQTVVPIEYGIGIAQENAGVMVNRGVEFTLGGNYSFPSGLRLEGNFNFTYARNKILQIFENPLTRNNPLRARTGRPLNTPFGLKAERLYQESDFDEYGNLWADLPEPTFSDVAPGDIKWADLNGDGVIDGADETALGYPKLPQVIYGFTIKAMFKGLDFSALFQGAGQSTTFIDGGLAFPFAGGENPPRAAMDYWTPQNTDAAYPRLYGTGGGNSNNFRRGNNDWFRRSGNYLRLKNVELGYTFSRGMFPKLPLQSMRIYLSGQNLWTVSDLKDFYDPEMGQVGDDANTRGWYSPQRRVVSVGLNITF